MPLSPAEAKIRQENLFIETEVEQIIERIENALIKNPGSFISKSVFNSFKEASIIESIKRFKNVGWNVVEESDGGGAYYKISSK